MTLEQLFNFVMLVLIKPCLLLAVYWLVIRLLTRSASARHFLLAVGLFSLLLLPLLATLGPQWVWQFDIQALINLEHPAYWREKLVQPEWLWLAGGIYVFIAFWLLFYQLAGLAVLMIDTAQAKPWQGAQMSALVVEICEQLMLKRPVSVVMTASIHSAQVWGLWRSHIMLPEAAQQWSCERLRFVLTHELAHVARWDWLSSQLMRMICAVFWFLPPVWWLNRQARQCAELASDDHIQRLQGLDLNSLDYAEHLFDLACCAKNPHYDSAMQLTEGSPMFQRVNAMLDEQRKRAGLNENQKGWAVILGVVVLIPLASVQASSIQQISQSLYETEQVLDIVLAHESEKTPISVAFDDLPAPAVDLSILKAHLLQAQGLQRPVFELTVTAPLSAAAAVDAKALASVPRLKEALEPEIYIRGFMPIRLITPNYPNRALARGIEGEVMVQFDIAVDGLVDNISVVYAQPQGVFNREVLKAVRQFRYSPQMISGQPVRVEGVSETFTFRLEDPNAPVSEQGLKRRRPNSSPPVTEIAQGSSQ